MLAGFPAQVWSHDTIAGRDVLASVAGAFAEQDVSIQTVRQEGRGDAATLVLVTHSASDAALAKTVDRLTGMHTIRRAASVMRVEGTPGD